MKTATTKFTYAVFAKMHPSEYEPQPEWKRFTEWHDCAGDCTNMINVIKKNPRFDAAKIVQRTEIYIDFIGE